MESNAYLIHGSREKRGVHISINIWQRGPNLDEDVRRIMSGFGFTIRAQIVICAITSGESNAIPGER